MESWILAVFLFLFALEFAVEFALNEINLRYVRARAREQKIPVCFDGQIDAADYEKSVAYTLAKGRLARWSAIYGRGVLLTVLFSGLLGRLDRWAAELAGQISSIPYAHGIVFCLAVSLVFSLASLPTSLCSIFGVEAQFGFNKMTLGLYVADKIKALSLALVIGAPFLLVVLWLMDAMGRHWWLWTFVFILAFELVMIVVYPTWIAPWFNKFQPLKEGELRERIMALARQLRFQASGIYVMDGSRRSAHSNAYFTGIGKSQRIVLFDTLIEQMTADQTVAVLAHEMGHYKMKHVQRMLVVQSALVLGGLYVLSRLLDYRPFFSAFGLVPSHHAALVLFSLLSDPATFYLGPLLHWLSRKHEYEADRFAAETLGDARPMEEALVHLTVKNLANLTPHPWYSAYHYSHPTAIERIDAIRRLAT
ncbi:MAG TPA: M48 family metallopeptidase [Candidatus Binatia bacterium]|nr:M48 family metallopeptidase [Candidatus Binatia bacterium]